MKSAKLKEYRKPLVIEEVPIPEIGCKEILVKVEAAGICGTDLHMIEGRIPVRMPITLGHEIAGKIEKVGDNVLKFKVGDRVCLNSITTCGVCGYCLSGRDNLCRELKVIGEKLDGGFAEYVKAPAKNVFFLPENIPFEQGAILTDCVATGYHALQRSQIKAGDCIAIWGIGGLGIMLIQMAKFHGAYVIAVDRKTEKLEFAKRAGADFVIPLDENTVKQIRIFTHGEGVEAAFDMVGNAHIIEQAIKSIRRGGRMVMVGMCFESPNLNMTAQLVKEIDIVGAWTVVIQDFPRVIEMVQKGMINPSMSITHEIPFNEINRGIEILKNRINNPLRVVVKF